MMTPLQVALTLLVVGAIALFIALMMEAGIGREISREEIDEARERQRRKDQR